MQIVIVADKLPTATAQQKGVRMTRKGPHFYEKSKVTEARKFYRDTLLEYMGEDFEPFTGPISVSMNFLFSVKTKPKSVICHDDEKGVIYYKVTRPDLDNLSKLILDAGTDAGLWKDDAQICNLTLSKFVRFDKKGKEQEESLVIVINKLGGES